MSTVSTKIRTRLSRRVIYGIILLIIFSIALALRVWLPYENVFMGDWVRFGGADPWYHIRLVENLVHHFPHRIAFDPFTLYPYGQNIPFAPFFDLFLGFLIWVIGLGSPTQHTIEIVGAYFPAILGALVTVPVYFIGRELFNRNVGLLSAGLIAILPGEFLFRSLLGFTDHHIAEVLFSATAVLFLILAIKRAKEKETSFGHIRSGDWKNLKKPLIYALLTGLSLGIYLLSWSGGLLFVFIILIYVIIQYIIDHLRGKSTDYLCIIVVPIFLIALIMVIPFLNLLRDWELLIASLTIGVLAFPVLSGVSRLMAYVERTIKSKLSDREKAGLLGLLLRLSYPLSLVVLGLAGLGLFYLIVPSLFHSMVGRFSIFLPSEAAQTIGEVQPLLSLSGLFSLLFYFTTDIFLALIALGLLIRAEVKEGSSEKTFLVIWCLIMLLAMLAQRRFAYYFAVNVALLAGYLSWRILEWIRSYLREALPELLVLPQLVVSLPRRYISTAVAVVIVFLLAFSFNILVAMNVAAAPGGPNEDWHSALLWMRENTPDPFGDPGFYYESYERPPSGEGYDYPESAYGVMSWWDYGHWITRIAHRIPNANPFEVGVSSAAALSAAAFFISQDEASANEILDSLSLGSKYVIIDVETAVYVMKDSTLWGKFYAVIVRSGKERSEFFEVYWQRTAEEELAPKLLYYPEYYQSMCSRLYNFGGEAAVPNNSTLVISYEERTLLGWHYKEISSIQSFATYEEAQTYLESQTAPNYRIVGEDPFISPVPLEELEHYKLVYRSDPAVVEAGVEGVEEPICEEPISYVKIFEYLP